MPHTVTIRVPDEEFERMERKRFDERTSFQEIGLEAFRNWLSDPKAQTSGLAPSAPGLTDDQIDTLEMLSADWEEEFGFSQIQYLVTAALEKYRARRKILRPGKPARRSKVS